MRDYNEVYCTDADLQQRRAAEKPVCIFAAADVTDFEWVIVDDGSQDDTEEIVRGMQAEKRFSIVYIKTENGGKHRAWNIGVRAASGEMIFGCDSDDYLTDGALTITDQMENSIPEEEKCRFAGICGLKVYPNSELVGETFSNGDYKDMTHLERVANHVSGDKSEVIYTDVWKKYAYHEFPGEKFLTEATALNRMAEDGLKMRYFNTPIKVIEYLPDGLSAGAIERFAKNPRGWGLYLGQQIRYRQLTGRKKCQKLWEYYDACVRTMTPGEMAECLGMPERKMKCCILAARIRRKMHIG